MLQWLDKIADYVQGRSERRRNRIAQLEKEQDELKKKPDTSNNNARLIAIDIELGKLRKEALNQ